MELFTGLNLMVIKMTREMIMSEQIIGFKILFAMMLLDVISGLLKAIKEKRLRSFIMSWGIIKKGGIILSIILSLLLDILVNGGKPAFGTLITLVSVANEALSVIENLDAIGVKVPAIIMDKIMDLSETNPKDYDGNPFFTKEKHMNSHMNENNKEE